MADGDLRVRSYRPGDEQETVLLYNEYFAGFTGPFRLSPEDWLAQWQASWRSPGLEADPECLRVAERRGRVVGYAVADHAQAEYTVLQEVCVARWDDPDQVARALVEDAEAVSRARGKLMMLSHLPHEDALATRVTAELGYEFDRGGATFMTLITDLVRFLEELAPELEGRLAASKFAAWQGEVALRSGDLEAELHVRDGRVKATRASRPGAPAAAAHLPHAARPAVTRATPMIAAEIVPERLPLLLLGRSSVGEAYLADDLAVIARDRREALRLLDVLFPPLPLHLPRQQWW